VFESRCGDGTYRLLNKCSDGRNATNQDTGLRVQVKTWNKPIASREKKNAPNHTLDFSSMFELGSYRLLSKCGEVRNAANQDTGHRVKVLTWDQLIAEPI
jgi:hypothetical protein